MFQLPTLNQGQAEGISAVRLPSPRALTPENTDKTVKEAIARLAQHDSYFAAGYKELIKQKYSFVLFQKDKDLGLSPVSARRMANGEIAALTQPSQKRIILHPEAMIKQARDDYQLGEHQALLPAAINELAHVISGKTGIPFYNLEQSSKAFGEMVQSRTLTEAEKNFHDMLVEECVSDLAMEIVMKRLQEPKYILPESGLSEEGNAFRFNSHQKYVIARHLFPRMFEGAPPNMKATRNGDPVGFTVTKRVEAYLESGELEKRVLPRLQALGLAAKAQ